MKTMFRHKRRFRLSGKTLAGIVSLALIIGLGMSFINNDVEEVSATDPGTPVEICFTGTIVSLIEENAICYGEASDYKDLLDSIYSDPEGNPSLLLSPLDDLMDCLEGQGDFTSDTNCSDSGFPADFVDNNNSAGFELSLLLYNHYFGSSTDGDDGSMGSDVDVYGFWFDGSGDSIDYDSLAFTNIKDAYTTGAAPFFNAYSSFLSALLDVDQDVVLTVSEPEKENLKAGGNDPVLVSINMEVSLEDRNELELSFNNAANAVNNYYAWYNTFDIYNQVMDVLTNLDIATLYAQALFGDIEADITNNNSLPQTLNSEVFLNNTLSSTMLLSVVYDENGNVVDDQDHVSNLVTQWLVAGVEAGVVPTECAVRGSGVSNPTHPNIANCEDITYDNIEGLAINAELFVRLGEGLLTVTYADDNNNGNYTADGGFMLPAMFANGGILTFSPNNNITATIAPKNTTAGDGYGPGLEKYKFAAFVVTTNFAQE